MSLRAALIVLFVALSGAAPSGAQEALGTRNFVLGNESQYFVVLPGPQPLALGGWQGEWVLEAGAPDGDGVVPISGGGTIFVDILGGSQGRLCRRIESCSGMLYCAGGHNVDVSTSLDSEGCQGTIGGSGNATVVVTGSGASDSGVGSLLLTCQVSENTPAGGQTTACDSLVEAAWSDPEEFVFTTGTTTTTLTNSCVNSGILESVSESGEAFRCDAWETGGSAGVLAFSTVREEPSFIFLFDLGERALFEDIADPVCGNSVLETGEECESDGNCSDAFYCSSDCACTPDPVCGNLEVELGEECDDGAATASCDGDCSFPACGDGTFNPSASEGCEIDSDCLSTEICTSGCACVSARVCGNGRIEEHEVCDDAGTEAGDGCDAACQPELPFRVTLANLNLLHDVFEDNDIEDRLALVAEALAVQGPDIVTLQEVTEIDNVGTHAWLIDRLNTQYGLVYFGVRYGNASAGQAVLSVWPVKLREVEALPPFADLPFFPDRRFFGRVEVDSPIGPLDVYSLHFCAGSQGCTPRLRKKQANALVDFLAESHQSPHPYLVGGDFNSHRGSAEDADPQNGKAIKVMISAGLAVLFDGADAPCNAPGDASGCTSDQELRADGDTTSRRIDNILAGPATTLARWVEVGPTQTFASTALRDPAPECAYDSPTACAQSSDCSESDATCNQKNGTCEPDGVACSSDDDCPSAAHCELVLWPSDHHGVTTRVELRAILDPAALRAQLRCTIAKQRAVTRDASCRLRRAALALRSGSEVDDSACVERLTAAFSRAEARYGVCATNDDASDRAEATRVFVAGRIHAITEAAGIDGASPNRCASSRSRALASHYRCENTARQKELRGRDGQRLRARCDAALERSWARALRRYSDTCGEADPVETFIEANLAAAGFGDAP
jgi:cysteine-rich repeat protein